jgi:hypothetical protein
VKARAPRIQHVTPVLVALAWLFASSSASAHPTPGSVAFVDFTVDGARLEQDVPIEELERALHGTLALPQERESAANIVSGHEQLLRTYAGAHLRATSAPRNAVWSVAVVDVTGHDASDGPRALFHFVLHAPAGEAAHSLNLHDDIVAHEVVSHYTAMYVRSDWSAGALNNQPHLVGTIHAGRNDVTVTRAGSFFRGFRSIVTLGMEHIASGTDHLIFLFTLVLVAPIAAVSGRWAAQRSTRDTLLALARVVSAFTLGHSLTLALGALGGVTLPTTPVEAGIALSILVTALHALRPMFPRREALIACAFGLVHGLAFASSLAGRDLGRAQAMWTLLGFNLGIELAQLALLALVLPWLLMLARSRAYTGFRIAGASVSAVLALAWLVERTTGLPNPTARPVAWLEAHPIFVLIALASCALGARVADRNLSRVPAETASADGHSVIQRS